MQCAIPSKIREMTRILEIIGFVIDLRVCWGQGFRGQNGVGVKVRNLLKTKVKNEENRSDNFEYHSCLRFIENYQLGSNWGQVKIG